MSARGTAPFGNARRAGVIFLLIVIVLVVLPWLRRHRPVNVPRGETPKLREAPAEPVVFVGETVCASCHPREDAMWKGTHHQLAMQPANAISVEGDFDERRFDYAGITTRFFRRGGKFMVRTDGPNGALADYEVQYTFGVAPLQQYLVELPGGRLQALEIAWDARSRDIGGQRWFHLYPGQKITYEDPLHWTGLAENWNGMCADCHSTNVRRSYDEGSKSYATTYAEMSVSCEACHGPGSRHVALAHAATDWTHEASKGLLVPLSERRGVAWTHDESTGKPRRSRPRSTQVELDVCARCHSRRGLVHEDDVHGQPVGDDYRVSLLDEGLYYPDGQMRGEVYEYGSFVQSRMFAEGVTCGDCHDAHHPELRGSGDGVCLQCHEESTYHTTKHHFHAMGSPGSRCVSCHMPSTTYMVVDARHDHSLRVPRPDQTVKLGVPNACNSCHSDRSATWAARTVAQWYGETPSGHQHFAEALAAGDSGAPGAARLLSSLIADRSQPAIARATALERLDPLLTPSNIGVVEGALTDEHPLVRRGAVRALDHIEPNLRARMLASLANDRERAVRVEVASSLAWASRDGLDSAIRTALDRPRSELVEAQRLTADRPEAHLNLALFYASQHPDLAEAQLKEALAIDATFAPAAVNLADLYRAERRDAEAESVLREALRRAPPTPSLFEALGLVMVRQKRNAKALEAFGAGMRIAPDDPRCGYLHALTLHDRKKVREAIRELEEVLARNPYDRDTLSALASFVREAGDLSRAVEYEQRLANLVSDDGQP